jgi:hypothetical protein
LAKLRAPCQHHENFADPFYQDCFFFNSWQLSFLPNRNINIPLLTHLAGK